MSLLNVTKSYNADLISYNIKKTEENMNSKQRGKINN